MEIFKCLNPRVIRNPYNGELMTVPCGCCKACQHHRSVSWAERLEIERYSHEYCSFVTLTYDNAHMRNVYIDNGLIIDDSDPLNNVICGDLYDSCTLSDVDEAFLKKVRRINICKSSDIQMFVKRLRNRLNENETTSFKRTLRYFAVQEYGPRTFRPHWHLLLFFESRFLADNLLQVVSACWTDDNRAKNNSSIGRVDAQHVIKSASTYVAGYLSSLNDLPSFYCHPYLRPKMLCSRFPAIGTLFINEEKIKEIFVTANPKTVVFSYRTQSVISVPLPHSIRDRLFPKIKGFDSFSINELRRLYNLAETLDVSSYDEFEEKVCDILKNKLDFVSEYLYRICSEFPSTLRRFYCMIRRVSYNATIFGVSINDYVDKIIEFYQNTETEKYKDWVISLDENIRTHKLSCSDLLLLDSVKFDELRTRPLNKMSYADKLILNSYGYEEDEFIFTDDLSLDALHLFQDFVSKSNSWLGKISKKRMMKDYLDGAVTDTYMFNLITKFYG